ncbi:hypothetical protein TGAM01_v208928 [Trichoderma gamsii]|uniref:Uncharacterized protein n=1 Tax=Trichoderma gamsii TaxID=398673 RepID=A0A2P4ZD77_9HYPO|nr:hypothetical protein TGAM01_v208928 [Trichoderma gamsii]PON22247.1 hypothetical protein TGAM01_v208928 [Trichoderma gamsii]
MGDEPKGFQKQFAGMNNGHREVARKGKRASSNRPLLCCSRYGSTAWCISDSLWAPAP